MKKEFDAKRVELGTRIRRLRKSHDLSQDNFAEDGFLFVLIRASFPHKILFTVFGNFLHILYEDFFKRGGRAEAQT